MRAMKDSGIEWIGEIPESWSLCRIKRVAEIITGNTPSKASDNLNYSEDGIMWIKPDNLMGTIPIQETIEHLSEEGTKLARVVPSKTPLICCIGTVGKVGYAEEEASFNQQINAICFDNTIDTRFGLYCLIAQEEQQKCFANGNVLKILNAETQGNLFIAIPPLDEQMNISKYLDTKCAEIDALIAAKEKTNTLLKERRQSIIYEAVTKGLDPTVPMKDSGVEWIGEIPEGWEIIRAKYVATIANGSDPKEEGDTPVYGSGSDSFRTCGEYKEGPAVLIGRKGATLHIPHYVEGKYWNVDTAFDVKTDESKYLLKYYYYASICFDYKLYISTTTLPSMTQTNYGNMFLPFPSTREQQEIINHIEKTLCVIDSLILTNATTIQKLKEYRQSLIYEAVTGKIEV